MLNIEFFGKTSKTKILFTTIFLLNAIFAFAQGRVTGKVTDKNGIPLIGVNIKQDGTTNGTITDSNGSYAINAEQAGVLTYSYIGYISQSKKVKGNILNVTLTDDEEILEEVVVVGYGKMTRKDVTSSITTVKPDEFNAGVYSNPAQLLQGKVPGLTITQNSDPNAAPSVTLRGASSLRSGAMEPYYVVDGVPGVSLSSIAPDDIISIDVLRDASATAIYGSKAANGVIIITTKKGKSGASAVSYHGYVAFDKVAKNWDLMTGDEYKKFVTDNGIALEAYDDHGLNTDWQKEVQRSGLSTNHNVSIMGGSENSSFNASVNYMKNEGVIKGSDMERFIGRAYAETKTLNNRLLLSFNLNASLTEQNYLKADLDGMSVFDAMTYYIPLSPVKNEDGSWFENTGRSQYYNPVSLIEENTDFVKTKNLQFTGKASLNILPGLNYDFLLTYQNDQQNLNYYNSSKSLAAAGMNGKATRRVNEGEKKVMEMYFNYDKTFNKKHKVGALAGYSWEENSANDGFSASVSDFFNDDLGYQNLGAANNINTNSVSSYAMSTLRMISVFGRLNYSYDSKYILQATIRRDGSSAFGKNNRWGTFPSASVAWRLAEESFVKDLNLFDDLKFRVGYGVSGNSFGFDVFTASALYGVTGWFTASDGKDYRTLGAIRNSNPNLKWEKTAMTNVGIDFALFNSRLSGTVEYYNKYTSDLIDDYEVSTAKYLYPWLTTNVGEISNKGIEVSLNIVPVKTKDFTWMTGLNFAHNKNRVEKLSNEEFSKDFMDKAELNAPGQTGNQQQRIIEGESIGTFYTWEWAGYNEEGVSVFYVRDEETGERTGETTATPGKKDRAKTGCAQPKLVYGWNNSLSYRHWTLSVFFQGVVGNDVLNATRARLSNVANAGNRNMLADIIKTEKTTDINSHYLSDRYIEDGSYLRLSTLSLSYDFGKVSDNVKGLRLYATCNNPFVITKYKGIDPEVSLGGLTPGIDNRQTYPRTRTLIIGANINF